MNNFAFMGSVYIVYIIWQEQSKPLARWPDFDWSVIRWGFGWIGTKMKLRRAFRTEGFGFHCRAIENVGGSV